MAKNRRGFRRDELLKRDGEKTKALDQLSVDLALAAHEEPNIERLWEDFAVDVEQDERDDSDEERERKASEFLRGDRERILAGLEYDKYAGDKPWVSDQSVPDHVKQPSATFDEYGVHDSFYDFAKTYERLRRAVADEMRREEPGREQYMLKALGVIHQQSKAESVEAFVDEVCQRLANAKVTIVRAERNETIKISRAEVESYVMAYLWTVVGRARAEINRERNAHQLTQNEVEDVRAELKRAETRARDRERKAIRKNKD